MKSNTAERVAYEVKALSRQAFPLQLVQYFDSITLSSGPGSYSNLTGNTIISEVRMADNNYFQRSNTIGGPGFGSNSDIPFYLGNSSLKMILANPTNSRIFVRAYYVNVVKDLVNSTTNTGPGTIYDYMTWYLNNGGSTQLASADWGMIDLDVTDDSRKNLRVAKTRWTELEAGKTVTYYMRKSHYGRQFIPFEELGRTTNTQLVAVGGLTYAIIIQAYGQPLSTTSSTTTISTGIVLNCYTYRRLSWRSPGSPTPNYYYYNDVNTATSSVQVVSAPIKQAYVT